MKKSVLLFSLLLIAFSGFSQDKQKTIGVQLSPGIYKHQFFDKVQFPFTGGLFYSHDLARRSGIMTGIHLTYERIKFENIYVGSDPGDLQYEKNVTVNYKTVDIPLVYAFTLNPENGSGLRSVLYSGFIFSPLYFSKQIIASGSERREYSSHGAAPFKFSTFLTLGFEMRQILNDNYTLAFGPSVKVQPYNQYSGFSLFSESRNPLVFNVNLKFGRNL